MCGIFRKLNSIALFWICAVQLIFAALIAGLCTAYFTCGMNVECFERYVAALMFVVPSSVWAYYGMQVARKKEATRKCVLIYSVVCFALSLVEAFISVNLHIKHTGILQPAWQGFSALQAATGICAFIYSQMIKPPKTVDATYDQL